MAKKKKEATKESDDEKLSDFDDGEVEATYPKLEKKAKELKKEEEAIPAPPVQDGAIPEEELMSKEELEAELEEDKEIQDYKYLKLSLIKKDKEGDYELVVHGQAHGFCNILVKKLLSTEGVVMSAYKTTNIEPSKIFIRVNEGYKLKDILNKSIESLREDVLQVKELFQKII